MNTFKRFQTLLNDRQRYIYCHNPKYKSFAKTDNPSDHQNKRRNLYILYSCRNEFIGIRLDKLGIFQNIRIINYQGYRNPRFFSDKKRKPRKLHLTNPRKFINRSKSKYPNDILSSNPNRIINPNDSIKNILFIQSSLSRINN